MPDERLSHQGEGRSRKLSSLSDFEFRVWCQYRLSANDLGVMLHSPLPLMTDNSVLQRRGEVAVAEAIGRLIAVGLLLIFEHQGEGFVCSREWQDYQKVRHPRETSLPLPPAHRVSAATRALIEKLVSLRNKRGGEAISATVREHSGNVSEIDPQRSGNVTGALPEDSGSISARARAGIANANANANAQDRGEPERGTGAPDVVIRHAPLVRPQRGNIAVPWRVNFFGQQLEQWAARLGGVNAEDRVLQLVSDFIARFPPDQPIAGDLNPFRWWDAVAAEEGWLPATKGKAGAEERDRPLPPKASVVLAAQWVEGVVPMPEAVRQRFAQAAAGLGGKA